MGWNVAAIYLGGTYVQEKVKEKKELMINFFRSSKLFSCCCKGESEPIRRESLYEMVEDDGDGFGQVNVGDDTYHEL